MSTRFRIKHHERIHGTVIEYRADINDDQYSGSVQEKTAMERFFEWDYPKIDERDPFGEPVQKSSFLVDLTVVQGGNEFNILEDILGADEQRFTIDFYIDGDHKWSGNVLTDLMTYPEAPKPWSGKIKAKDLSILDGKKPNLGLISGRSRLSEVLALCFQQTGFTFPIRSYTNVTNTEVTEANDFLYELWHENRAFYDSGVQMYAMEMLEYICRAYNLIIRQSDARWIIEQIPAVFKGDDTQFDYDSDGLNPTSSTPSRTVAVDRVDSFLLPSSNNKVTGPLKFVESTYNHKTPIYTVPTDPVDYTFDPEPNTDKFSVSHGDKGGHAFAGSVDVSAELSESNTGGSVIKAYFRVRSHAPDISDLWMANDGSFSTSQQEVEVTLSGSGTTVTGSFSIDQSNGLPGDVVEVEFLFAVVEDDVGTGVTVTETHYSNINMYVFQTFQSVQDKGATIRHRYERTGNYSVSEEIPETVLGDGPTLASVGAPASDEFGTTTLTPGNFIVRGEVAGSSITLEELTLRERTSMRRDALRNLRAALWMKYSPESLISYDGETWFFLGGQLTGRRSRWDANILNLGYSREAGDSFTTVVESGGDPEGTTGTGGENTTSGVTLSEGDARWLNEADNGADIPDPSAFQTNIKLKDATADLDLNSISVNGTNLFPGNDPQNLGTGDDAQFRTLNVIESSSDADTHKFFVGRNASEGMGVAVSDGQTFVNFLQDETSGSHGVRFNIDSPTSGDFFYEFRFNNSFPNVLLMDSTDGVVFDPGMDITGGKVVTLGENNFDGHSLGRLVVNYSSSNNPSLASFGDTIEVEDDLSLTSGKLLSGNTFQLRNSGDTAFQGLELSALTVNDALTMTFGNIATDNFSDWFSASPAGWEIAYDGTGDFRTLLIDELIAKAFTADVAQALAGSDFLTKSVAKVAENFTIPAVSASGTLKVEDLEGLGDLQTFEVNDWVRIRIVDTTSSPAVIGDVWGQVTSYVDNADGTQDWTFTVDYAGASDVLVGQTVYKGAIVLDYGQSGDTYIERTVLDRSSGTDFSKVPYDRIVRWTGSDPRTGAKEVLVQKGNLNGLADYGATEYGFFAGSGSGEQMTMDPTNGFRLLDDFDNIAAQLSGSNFTVGDALDYNASTGVFNFVGFSADANRLLQKLDSDRQVVMGDTTTTGFWGFGVTESGGFTGSDSFVRMFSDGAGAWGIQGHKSGNTIFRLGNTNEIGGWSFTEYFESPDADIQLSPISGINLEAPFGITGYSSISWFKDADFDDQNDLTAYVQGEYFAGDDQSTLNLVALNAGTTYVRISADEIQLAGNDVVVPDDLPTSDPVSAGKLFTQTATQLGGSGTEKVLCVSAGGTPSAPSQPSVCKQSNALVISWQSEPGAASYDVQYRTGGSGTFTTLESTTNTSVSDTAPAGSPDTIYEYRVRACNINGCSAYSTESADTTYNTASSC